MSTQLPQNMPSVESAQSSNSSNSLWDLAGTSASNQSGTGVYYNVIMALAGNMDMVMQIMGTNANELVVLMQSGQNLMQEMQSRANNEDISYTEATLQSSQSELSTQKIASSASETSMRMGQNAQLISGDKAMGNRFTQMFSATSRA